METVVKNILKAKHVYITESRLKLLKTFLQSDRLLDFGILYYTLHPDIDRVTIFRNLNLFVHKDIILKIPDNNGKLFYTIHHHNEHSKATMEVVICCEKCHGIFRSRKKRVMISLPAGFKNHTETIIVRGTCKDCK